MGDSLVGTHRRRFWEDIKFKSEWWEEDRYIKIWVRGIEQA